jgi:serine/threonine protein kinase
VVQNRVLFASRLTRLCALPFRVPFITQILGAFQDSCHIYLVMEYCARGDLLERLLKEGRPMAEERVATDVAMPLLQVSGLARGIGGRALPAYFEVHDCSLGFEAEKWPSDS